MSSQQLKLSPLSKIPWEPAGQGHRWAYSSVKLQGPLQGSGPDHSWRGQGQCQLSAPWGLGRVEAVHRPLHRVWGKSRNSNGELPGADA